MKPYGHRDGWFWWFLILLGGLAAIALVDIRISTRTQLGVASVGAILVLLVIVLAKGGDAGVTLAPFDPGRLPSAHGLFLGVVLAFTGFIGFEAAAALGEEAANPLQVVPRAILMAIGVGVVYYVFLAWVMAVGFGVDHIDRWATNPAALDALATRYAGTSLAVSVDLAVAVVRAERRRRGHRQARADGEWRCQPDRRAPSGLTLLPVAGTLRPGSGQSQPRAALAALGFREGDIAIGSAHAKIAQRICRTSVE